MQLITIKIGSLSLLLNYSSCVRFALISGFILIFFIQPKHFNSLRHQAKKYKVAFTFDDGPHPFYTPFIARTLNRHRVKAGFFTLGTAVQSFLVTHGNLSVHLLERPRLGFLLLQDYSLIEKLYEGHDIYLHGWVHEKISEMRLQTVVDNISTQLLEIGLLKNFKPVYRAPWGMGTSPGYIKNKTLLSKVLDQMGIVPAFWNVDSKDYLPRINENNLINHTLRMICKAKGGHILMHDNRPTTAYAIDRIIRSIRGSGHIIVSPGEINPKWNDQTIINRSRKYIALVRRKVHEMQSGRKGNSTVRNAFRPVEISLSTEQGQMQNLNNIEPIARYEGLIKVFPSVNDV